MLVVLKRILEERQVPDLIFDYYNQQQVIISFLQQSDKFNLNVLTILFDLEEHISKKEKEKIILPTDFKKLPLEKDTNIEDIKFRIFKEPKSNKRRSGMSVLETKEDKEISFIDNFFHTHEGRNVSQLFPNIGTNKKKKKKIEEEEVELEQMNNENEEIKHQDQDEAFNKQIHEVKDEQINKVN